MSQNEMLLAFLVGCLVSYLACFWIGSQLVILAKGKWVYPALFGLAFGVLSFFLMGQAMLAHSEGWGWFWCLMMLTGGQIFGQCFKARDKIPGNDYWN